MRALTRSAVLLVMLTLSPIWVLMTTLAVLPSLFDPQTGRVDYYLFSVGGTAQGLMVYTLAGLALATGLVVLLLKRWIEIVNRRQADQDETTHREIKTIR